MRALNLTKIPLKIPAPPCSIPRDFPSLKGCRGFIFHSIHNTDLSKVTMATSRQCQTNTGPSLETAQNKPKSPRSHPGCSRGPSSPEFRWMLWLIPQSTSSQQRWEGRRGISGLDWRNNCIGTWEFRESQALGVWVCGVSMAMGALAVIDSLVCC